MNMKNFNEDKKMDSYEDKNIASCLCHSCGCNVMVAEPEKGDKIFCPRCGCIIRGEVLGEDSQEDEPEEKKDDESTDDE